MEKYNFHTHVKINIFTPEELLDYKQTRGENSFPRYNRIRILLPNWFVKEIKAQVDTSGKVRFSEINRTFTNSANLILDLAKRSSLTDNHNYKLEEIDSAKLMVTLKQDQSTTTLTPTFEICPNPKKQDNVVKFLNFIVYTILDIKDEEIKEQLFEHLDLEVLDSQAEENLKIKGLKNCINHLFFWTSNHASRNLHREVEQGLNAKTHFVREYGNWFTREVLRAKYMYVEYKAPFEAITCPIDYSTRKLNDALFELEERKKVGTITYDKFEILTYYKLQEGGDFIKGAVIRITGFVNSDFPVCFVFKMRSMDYETVKEELIKVRDQKAIIHPKAYLQYLNNE